MKEILKSSRHLQFFIITIVLIQLSHQFYLPGLAPVNYCKESEKTKSCKVSELENVSSSPTKPETGSKEGS